jgi:hypothetical protein
MRLDLPEDVDRTSDMADAFMEISRCRERTCVSVYRVCKVVNQMSQSTLGEPTGVSESHISLCVSNTSMSMSAVLP